MTTHLDLVEFDDGIYVRVTPRQPLPPPPFYPGDVVRCAHQAAGLPGKPGEPILIDKQMVGKRLFGNTVNGVDVVRGMAAGEAPKCGCWLLVAEGHLTPPPDLVVAVLQGAT